MNRLRTAWDSVKREINLIGRAAALSFSADGSGTPMETRTGAEAGGRPPAGGTGPGAADGTEEAEDGAGTGPGGGRAGEPGGNGRTAEPSGLSWMEMVTRNRLIGLAACFEAERELERHERTGERPAAAPAWMTDRLTWRTGKADGRLSAGLAVGNGEHTDRIWVESSKHARELAVRVAADPPEGRRITWTLLDREEGPPEPDQVRIPVGPLPDETDGRTVHVEVRTRPNVDGSLREDTVEVRWRMPDADGRYLPTGGDGERPDVTEPLEGELMRAARRLTAVVDSGMNAIGTE